MYQNSIFIFRRDFRLTDNLGLIQALENSKNVIPIFIFTPEQIEKNSYKSDNAIQFMIESLAELESKIKKKKGQLYYFYGKQDKIIKKLIKNNKIDAIYFNKDWTPYAIKRYQSINKICLKKDIDCVQVEDYTLLPINKLLNQNEEVYKVYGAFYRNAKNFKVPKPKKIKTFNFDKIKTSDNIQLNYIDKFYQKNDDILVRGGRKNAQIVLKTMKKFNQYSTKRNELDYETTHLSAYTKFGCVSIREVYHKMKKHLKVDNQLFNQLFWKEFYVYISKYIPHVLKGKSMKLKYDKIKWNDNNNIFKKWCEGKTGFPIVDAGMKELNKTGYMHNRSRLITSGFLVKLALIDWRKGEKYFAQKLTDYDPAQNNGGWQWSSGSGADSQPYFRIMSPISQSTKFDPDGSYIKKWIPELKDVEPKHLHDWEKFNNLYDLKKINYVEPCLDYKKARKRTMEIYKKYLN
jgi:deoxyribodipyrimidine photo-lyase